MGFVGKFFLLVLVLSMGEFWLLMWVAEHTSFWLTLSLCVLTGVVGGALVRAQGLATLKRISEDLSRGHLPATEIVSGLILLVIGTLLLTPGFITDTVAFLLLMPPLRRLAAAGLTQRMGKNIKVAHFGGGPAAYTTNQGDPSGTIIEVEAHEEKTHD